MKTGEKEICEFVSGVASRAARGERVDSIAASQVWEEPPPPLRETSKRAWKEHPQLQETSKKTWEEPPPLQETSKRAWKEHPPWRPQKYLKMLNTLVPGVPKSILEKDSFIYL